MDNLTFGGRQAPKTENPVGRRILYALKEIGRNPAWLAKVAELSATTVNDQIKNGIAKVDNAINIAHHLNVSLSWLLTGDGDDAVVHADVVSVPIYDIEVAAGAGRSIDDRLSSPISFWKFDRVWAEANLRDIPSLKMFYVYGDSQEPELSSNDIVAVNTRDTRLTYGLYVVRLDNQLMVKRVQRSGSQVVLLSRNELYTDVNLDMAADKDRFDVVGRVVWASKLL